MTGPRNPRRFGTVTAGPELVGDIAARALRHDMLERAAAELLAGDRVQASVYLALIVPDGRDHARELALDLAIVAMHEVAKHGRALLGAGLVALLPPLND